MVQVVPWLNFIIFQYLGSTVIRHLQGTISARKSIQKLKIEENLNSTSSVTDISLLENCNTSTKYLKAANLQTRLKVDIAASCVGVKFIDHETKVSYEYNLLNEVLTENLPLDCHLLAWYREHKLCLSGRWRYALLCLFNQRAGSPLLSCIYGR